MCIPPFPLLLLLKFVKLVIMWIRRRRKGRFRKIKINEKLNLNRPLLTMLRVFIFPRKHLVSVSYLPYFARLTIFKEDCHGLFQVLEMCSKASKQPMSLASSHQCDDTPSTSDSGVKSQKGKWKYFCLLCKEIHLTYLWPRMDKASKLLENIIVP